MPTPVAGVHADMHDARTGRVIPTGCHGGVSAWSGGGPRDRPTSRFLNGGEALPGMPPLRKGAGGTIDHGRNLAMTCGSASGSTRRIGTRQGGPVAFHRRYVRDSRRSLRGRPVSRSPSDTSRAPATAEESASSTAVTTGQVSRSCHTNPGTPLVGLWIPFHAVWQPRMRHDASLPPHLLIRTKARAASRDAIPPAGR